MDKIKLDPETSALILIDLQHGIVALETSPYPAAAVVAKAASLAATFRKHSSPVIYVRVDLANMLQVPADRSWPFGRDRTRNSCAYAVAYFLGRASLKGCMLAIQAEVIGIQRYAPEKWTRRVHTPKANLMVRDIVEESRFVQIGAHGESVDAP